MLSQKLALSILVAGIAVALGIGATFAWDAPNGSQRLQGFAIAGLGTAASFGLYKWILWLSAKR